MTRYTVLRLNADGDPDVPLGEVDLDESSMLTIVAAEESGRAALEKAVKDLNGRPALTHKLPPDDDKETGDREVYSLRKILVPRGDPGFFDAIQDNLRRWHEMTLAK